MEKQCRKCKLQKPFGEYYRSRHSGDGLDDRCKSCRKACNKQYYLDKPEKFREIRESHAVGGYVIYCLPDHNYIGMTNNVEYRMNGHRHHGKNTANVEILHHYESKEIAAAVESFYHSLGWDGMGCHDAVANTVWITNGKDNRRMQSYNEIPEGWWRGVTR